MAKVSKRKAEDDMSRRAILLSVYDTFELNSTPSTTASHNQSCLPPSTSPGYAPQPDFQDFSLFPPTTPAPQAPQRRAPSLASNQLPTFNINTLPRTQSAPQNLGTIRRHSRHQIPPVPLFNSQHNHQNPENYQTFDPAMGREINVAYQGDLDLGSNDLSNFSWDELCSSTESLPAMNMNFTAINNDTPAGTISPKDLLMDGGSVPPSAAFTNLTTPGSAYLDTPDDFIETSPMFDSLDAPETWPSLFPDSESTHAAAPPMTRTESTSSQIVVHPGGLSRKRSSTTSSPLTTTTRPSSSVGISKRDKPLPAIVVDPNDSVAVKRARNTAAARKSRAKKVQETELYLTRISELEQEVEHWKAIALAKSG
ncbi:Basic region leucine zipper-containing protein [Elsinoe fawcettii]|nr:Basic region leucine zipper-containing protein [Elsinoe fawcettii]